MSQNKARTPFDDPDNSGVDIPLSKNTQPLPPAGTVLSGLQSGTPTGNMATTPPPDYSTAPPDYSVAPPDYSAAPPPTYTPPAVFAPQPPDAPPAYAPPTPPPQPPAYAAPPAYPTQPPAYPPQAQPPVYPPPAQQPVYAPPTQQTVVYASAPPVATPPVAVPNVAASTGPLSGSRSRIPLPTLIGLAVAGGVVLAVTIPIMMRRAIPKVEMKDPPPAVAVATPITRQPIAKAPLVDDLEVGSEPTAARPAPRATARAADEPADSGVPPSAQGNGGLDGDPAGTEEGVVPGVESPDAQSNPSAADGVEEGSVPSAETGESAGTDGEPASSPSGGVSVAGSAGARAGAKRGRARRSERNEAWNYSITAPEGWAKTQSGKRTIWAGPGGAQLLVEVSEDVGSSPRADWEKLDRTFKKKYGRRYRNLGIRNTSLAGLPAAEWEFELDSRGGGTTRKIDVAVHQGRRGYAVLGSGRAEDMPELRPQIQAAIDSFRLKSQGSAGGSDEPERGF